MNEFDKLVLEWVQTFEDASAVKINCVHGDGTNWEGDREGGFYSTFNVYISWTRLDGEKGHVDCEGEVMESLWDYVVKGFR